MSNLEKELMEIVEKRCVEAVGGFSFGDKKEDLKKVYIQGFIDCLGLKEICQRICKE